MEGYFFVADLLGFSKIVKNSSEEKLLKRVKGWTSLIETGAANSQNIKIQLISDTIFAATDSNLECFKDLVNFARYLLIEGITQSLPVRGAISYGSFEWGKLTYGKAIIKAHELEKAQNWIGVTCESQLPHIQDLWSVDLVVCYPPPMRSGLIRLHPVVAWEIPEFSELVRYLCQRGLTKEGEVLTWDWGEKINNTMQFRMYLHLLSEKGEDCRKFHGFLPIEAIELEIFGK